MGAETGKRHLILGWTAVSIVLIIASLWAYWGGIENFHEGWYSESIWDNLFMALVQYWLFPFVFVIIGLIGVAFPKASLPICIILGIAAALIFSGAHFSVVWLMMVIPLTGIGLLFFFGRARPKKVAYILIAGIPILIIVATSIIGLVRISKRVNDGDFGMRKVETAGVCLIWAPRGPGWPDRGVSYFEAKQICAHLDEEGTKILEEEVGTWRLPSVEEAVASQMLHGVDAGGIWDPVKEKAEYRLTPDKETPLWDPHSKVIYYWTDTMVSRDDAYIIVYNGGVFSRGIQDEPDYLSFRAVKDCTGPP